MTSDAASTFVMLSATSLSRTTSSDLRCAFTRYRLLSTAVRYAPVRCGLTEQFRGSSELLILRRVEPRHRLADDLTSAVALDEASALIPRHDLSGGIEHEDRVILHARDQETAELVLERRIQRVVRLLHTNRLG